MFWYTQYASFGDSPPSTADGDELVPMGCCQHVLQLLLLPDTASVYCEMDTRFTGTPLWGQWLLVVAPV